MAGTKAVLAALGTAGDLPPLDKNDDGKAGLVLGPLLHRWGNAFPEKPPPEEGAPAVPSAARTAGVY